MQGEDKQPLLPGSGYMEDYTRPFLVVADVLVYFALVVLRANLGWPTALIATTAANGLVRSLPDNY